MSPITGFSPRKSQRRNAGGFTGAATSAILCLVLAVPASGASFTISGNSTTAQTLGSGSGQTGTVNAASTLTVSGGTVAVTITGNNATLTNLGTIRQTGTGRVIRDNTGVTNLIINNGSITNSTALMESADADVIQMARSPASVTLNNYGTMTSLNASEGGAQAVDFAGIISGSNTINNYSTGIMQAAEADAVRPGANGIVYNAGTIRSTTSTGSSSDGVDIQNNSGVQITNDGTGLIEGARHGITGGPDTSSETFITSVTNHAGGVIQGDNGAGINLDGFNANQSAVITNHGTITGNGRDIGDGSSHDGDGIDVDGIATITNTGTIRSANAFNIAADGVANSEAISVGGGTITNSGLIEGLVAVGNTNAVGRGISLLGNDITSGPLAGTREAIYANAEVTNQAGGIIRGDSDSGIYVGGPASGFMVSIDNLAGATIQGGATLAGLAGTSAAIRTGADNDTIANAGSIDGSSNGKAVDMGAGNNTLNIYGGAATVVGDINGGTGGTNALLITPGANNAFSYSGEISNFSDVRIGGDYTDSGNNSHGGGTVTLSGTSSYTGTTTVHSGKLVIDGNVSTSVLTTVSAGGTLGGTGRVGALVVESSGTLAPGNSPGILTAGDTTLQNGSNFDIQIQGGTAGTGYDQLQVNGTVSLAGLLSVTTTAFTPTDGSLFFIIVNDGEDAVSGVFSNAQVNGATYLLGSREFKISYFGDSLTSSFTGGNDVVLQAIPEPSAALLVGLFGLATIFRRRR
jgi:hypothetical protein